MKSRKVKRNQRKLYQQFEGRSKLISENQNKSNEFENQINLLNNSRSNMENAIYKAELKKEQIKERVETITGNIVDNYNVSIDYALKSYEPTANIRESEIKVRKFKT